MGEEDRVIITTRDIYDAVQGLSARFAAVENIVQADHKILEDHEARMRSNEAWKYGIPSSLILGLFGALGWFLR